MNEYAPKDSVAYRKPLFPPRKVPSFAEVAGNDAAADYRRIRDDLDAQEITARRKAKAKRRLGKQGISASE